MKLVGICVALLTIVPISARAEVGTTHEIVRVQDTTFATEPGPGSRGSTHDQDAIIERAVGETDAGVELEYDLPKEASKNERAATWQLPALILKRPDGSMQLLNEPELRARAERWLKSAHWTREVCEHLIFTWNAFRIECDPQSAITIVRAFDLGGAQVREGALYRDSGALQGAPLVRKPGPDGGAIYSVELPVDPEQVRQQRVETDLGVAEISGKKLDRADAIKTHASERISGTITIDFEANSAGEIWRRTRLTKIEIRRPDGQTESQRSTETLESRPIPAS
ncbi:MAG TPA: hypothetical protein VIC34_14940 [Croceibacterium sp.]|jgi:hypothetical protein